MRPITGHDRKDQPAFRGRFVNVNKLFIHSIMRQKPEWRSIPVLVFSGRSSTSDIEQAMNAGASEFLVKMMTSPAKLSERVRFHLAA